MNRHLLVCGHSRSGTTMFYAMLRAALQDFVFFDKEVSAVDVIGTPNVNFASKRPLDVFSIPEIIQGNVHNKRLDIIVFVRDPRSLVVSRHERFDGYCYSADHGRLLSGWAAFKGTLPGLIHNDRAINALLQAKNIGANVFTIRYEDLVRDPDGVQALLAKDLDLSFQGSFTDFHKQEIPEGLREPLNGIRPLSEDRMRPWEAPEHRERIIEQFNTHPELFDMVREYGYEEDDSWFEAFDQ